MSNLGRTLKYFSRHR